MLRLARLVRWLYGQVQLVSCGGGCCCRCAKICALCSAYKQQTSTSTRSNANYFSVADWLALELKLLLSFSGRRRRRRMSRCWALQLALRLRFFLNRRLYRLRRAAAAAAGSDVVQR